VPSEFWLCCLAFAAGVATASPSLAQSLDQQAKCGSEAERAFIQQGYVINGVTRSSGDPNGDYDVWAVYQSHYDPQLNRCFMLVETTGAGHKNVGDQQKFLVDANENRIYSEYMWIPRQDKKYWEVPPIECQLMPSLTEKTPCHSEAESMAFVARYIE
jgi:hypothetical protein